MSFLVSTSHFYACICHFNNSCQELHWDNTLYLSKIFKFRKRNIILKCTVLNHLDHVIRQRKPTTIWLEQTFPIYGHPVFPLVTPHLTYLIHAVNLSPFSLSNSPTSSSTIRHFTSKSVNLIYTVDPWTTQIWTAEIQLHTDFFQ